MNPEVQMIRVLAGVENEELLAIVPRARRRIFVTAITDLGGDQGNLKLQRVWDPITAGSAFGIAFGRQRSDRPREIRLE